MAFHMDPLVHQMVQNVVKSVDNIATKSCETLQPGSFYLKPEESTEYKLGICGCLTCLRKAASGKQTGKLLA